MRISGLDGDLAVRAVAGTHVVLFGMDVSAAARDGLLGFSIELSRDGGQSWFPLPNFVLFARNDQGAKPESSSLLNPFQEFVWGDYTVLPGKAYVYRVSSIYGTPDAPAPRDSVTLAVTTEDPARGTHGIYFNRGAVVGQRYAKDHGYQRPDQIPGGYTWLSRGLEEALIAFLQQANGPEWGLRAAVYEFEYKPVLEEFLRVSTTGADVQIVWDDVHNHGGDHGEDAPGAANFIAIRDTKLAHARLTKPRRATHNIAHNKFVVLLHNGEPVEVWTGSTNITEGGIFGHSNVGHAVRDPAIAAAYLAYWEQLHADGDWHEFQDWCVANSPVPAGPNPAPPPPSSITSVFSPQKELDALEWYASLLAGTQHAAFLTCAFTVANELQDVFTKHADLLRYLLVDHVDKQNVSSITLIRRDPNNLVAPGAFIGKGGWRQWVEEKVAPLNRHVPFIHTKYMLVDPLGEDPLVITGSANFSDASTNKNDENMLLIRGDKAVADVYVGEFMRLFTYYWFRGKTKTPPTDPAPIPFLHDGETPAGDRLHLQETSVWTDRFYVAGSPEEKERKYFSGTQLALPRPDWVS